MCVLLSAIVVRLINQPGRCLPSVSARLRSSLWFAREALGRDSRTCDPHTQTVDGYFEVTSRWFALDSHAQGGLPFTGEVL